MEKIEKELSHRQKQRAAKRLIKKELLDEKSRARKKFLEEQRKKAEAEEKNPELEAEDDEVGCDL